MTAMYSWTTAVTVLSLLVYLGTVLAVGRSRATLKIPAPSVTGPPEFERRFRVQQNTLEQIVLFLPALWLYAHFHGDVWAAIVGVVWPVGRIVYATRYYADPEKRGPGFLLTFAPTAVLLIGDVYGAAMPLWRG
jgi:glutathione S-transferase